MSKSIKTEWTKDEVVRVVTALAEKRHGLTFDSYVELVSNNSEKIDRCKDSDIIGLLALIGLGNLAAA
ncbi:MAG: hypothetical protein JSS83_17760 [Cyanobacteria bacterium SZAS LIN-3]|nr:hypothetical protein [Cyanobacteria bacterium SZAS LIN-3]